MSSADFHGVALTVVAASQGALISGHRAASGDVGPRDRLWRRPQTVVGIAVHLEVGRIRLFVFFVLLTPIASFLLSWW